MDKILPKATRVSPAVAVVGVLFILAMYSLSCTQAGAFGGCPNEESPGFRTYLPDCRAYELVTPAYKEAMTAGSSGGLSREGNRMMIQTFGSFSNIDTTATFGAIYELNRTLTGWRSTPSEAPIVATYPRFDESAVDKELTRSLWTPTYPDQGTEEIYRHEADGTFARVGPSGPLGATEPKLNFAGGSGDLSHLVFSNNVPLSAASEIRLWPDDPTYGEGQTSLYEYIGSANTEPTLVGVSNKGVVSAIRNSHLVSRCGTGFGNPEGDTYNAISQDGTTIFFTALGFDANRSCEEVSPTDEPSVNELYARIDNGNTNAHTVAISEPTKSDCEECDTSSPADAQFRGASLDGLRVFFTTRQHLLPSASGEGADLYQYNFNGPEGRKVTLISGGDLSGGRVQGVARISEDGSHVYFVAQSVLSGTAVNVYGESASENAENLYVYIQECSDGSSSCSEPMHHLSFVGQLSEADRGDWAGFDIRPVQATPEGRFLVFQSKANLTPDQAGLVGGEAGQVFEYDAQTGALARVSRGVNGYNNDGNSHTYAATVPTLSYGAIDYPNTRFTAVSDNGSYVFFASAAGLSPRAIVGFPSVYEYHNGNVALISDGHDLTKSGATLLGADGSGEDVFFASGISLAPQDGDTQEDIYDARINGGFAGIPVSPHCLEDSCQGSLTATLQPLAPPTLSSTGEAQPPKMFSRPAKKATPRQAKAKKKIHRKHRSNKAAKGRRR